MAQRTKVGLIYSYDENWIGGTYYILNLIHALHTLEEKDKPEITIFTDNQERYNELKEATRYSFLKFESLHSSLNRFEKLSNRITHKLLKRKLFNQIRLKPAKVSFLYPYPYPVQGMDCSSLRHVEWIPDFQEIHLPELFSREEIASRYKRHQFIATNADIAVFSSFDALEDFNTLFPDAACDTFVLNFAVTHPQINQDNFKQARLKYKLDRPYYFVPNQFWTHKNHIVIIEALKIAIKIKPSLSIVFSGKEFDNRTAGHVEYLKNLTAQYELDNNVKFLGFIPREEQLLILKNAIAIIQPSMFEGWSTVVEDAKAQGKFLVLSNIDVHQEQVKKNAIFFNPKDARELAQILIKEEKAFKIEEELDYMTSVKNFANAFMELSSKINTSK